MIHINLDKCCDKAIKNSLWLNYPNKTDTLVTKKWIDTSRARLLRINTSN